MKTIYKEEFVRRRLPVILQMTFLLTVTIFVSDFLEKIRIADRSIGFVSDPLLIVFMTVIIILSIEKCRERYRYSIIADQLMIHRVVKGELVIVENIKLDDIKYIGSASKLKDKLGEVSAKRYGCSLLAFDTFCCIYKQGNKINKFYFTPSEGFINRVSSLLGSEKKVC